LSPPVRCPAPRGWEPGAAALSSRAGPSTDAGDDERDPGPRDRGREPGAEQDRLEPGGEHDLARLRRLDRGEPRRIAPHARRRGEEERRRHEAADHGHDQRLPELRRPRRPACAAPTTESTSQNGSDAITIGEDPLPRVEPPVRELHRPAVPRRVGERGDDHRQHADEQHAGPDAARVLGLHQRHAGEHDERAGDRAPRDHRTLVVVEHGREQDPREDRELPRAREQPARAGRDGERERGVEEAEADRAPQQPAGRLRAERGEHRREAAPRGRRSPRAAAAASGSAGSPSTPRRRRRAASTC
jgi:hypothetical protein